MTAIDTLIQKIQNSYRHTQTFLEYFPNAILWSCLVFIFVNGIPGMNPLPEHDLKPPTVPVAYDVYKQDRGRRKHRRIYWRNIVQVLPTILEEEEEFLK
ncbi:hypothetical protein ACJ72_04905 [Emergomyces africanus]|uniref:Uncharacterized protein n=1 Tax=Emergomyces africanus TaxID=1955775 RepID=A0A1B7NVH9_9EURO|nr:hypothetical protein ACJ72_04905 [Emergomyces africanus]